MKMRRTISLTLAAVLLASMSPTVSAAGTTEAQRCEAAVESASGKLLSCRLLAESAYAKTGDATKRSAALVKCASKFSSAFDKAVLANGPGDCPSTPQGAFAGQITQCTDETTAVAHGGAFAGCGDGVIDASGELCDGADLGGDTCTTLGFAGGTLACAAACTFDTRGCNSPLPATGLTACWDASGASIACGGTGQDGALRHGALLAYADNGDGTVSDANTGLTWEKLSDDGGIHDKDTEYTWGPAFAHVAALNTAAFAGHTDWRLPNQRELESILDFANSNPAVAPAFNNACTPGCSVTACSCTKPTFIWSSSTWAYVPDEGWVTNFAYGDTYHQTKDAGWGVRAVRGGPA